MKYQYSINLSASPNSQKEGKNINYIFSVCDNWQIRWLATSNEYIFLVEFCQISAKVCQRFLLKLSSQRGCFLRWVNNINYKTPELPAPASVDNLCFQPTCQGARAAAVHVELIWASLENRRTRLPDLIHSDSYERVFMKHSFHKYPLSAK